MPGSKFRVRMGVLRDGRLTILISSDGGKTWTCINFRRLLEIVHLYYRIQDIIYPVEEGKLGRWYVAIALLELARFMDVQKVMDIFGPKREEEQMELELE